MKFSKLLLLIFIPLTTYSQLIGKVVSVADGDTFTMLVNNHQIKIRLHGIDCPEKGQDFYNVAKDYLSNLIFNKTVTVQKLKIDRYKRTVGIVFINDLNLNEELLKAGLAWHFKKYDKNTSWARLEEDARKKRRGLWVQNNAIPPWEWRKGVRGE